MSKPRKRPDHVKAATLAVELIKREPAGSDLHNLGRSYLESIKAVESLDNVLADLGERITAMGNRPVDVAGYLDDAKKDPKT